MFGSGSIIWFVLVIFVIFIFFCRIFRFYIVKCLVIVNDGYNCIIFIVFIFVIFDSFNGICRIVILGYSDIVIVFYYVGNIFISINFCL